jgi:hypothetical protein
MYAFTMAGPLSTNFPYFYSGLQPGGWARYGYGPNYGLGYGIFYSNPYAYMAGTYW